MDEPGNDLVCVRVVDGDGWREFWNVLVILSFHSGGPIGSGRKKCGKPTGIL
jgi:hypothetical protein